MAFSAQAVFKSAFKLRRNRIPYLRSTVFGALLFILGPVTSWGRDRTPSCIPDHIFIDKMVIHPLFSKKYCKLMSKTRCGNSWENFSRLLEKVNADKRIPNVGFVSYMFATVVIETQNRDLSFGAIEIKPNRIESKLENYWKEDFETGESYYGRGWVQLTHKEQYKLASNALKIDFLRHPEKALEYDNSYEILFRSLYEGWLETYRGDVNGNAAKKPINIRLTDFVSQSYVNYGLARAAVNANCKLTFCNKYRFNYKGKGFIPQENMLNRGDIFEPEAIFFEEAICSSIKNRMPSRRYANHAGRLPFFASLTVTSVGST
jgi:hypothetical protein